jgi:hypothetical protein
VTTTAPDPASFATVRPRSVSRLTSPDEHQRTPPGAAGSTDGPHVPGRPVRGVGTQAQAWVGRCLSDHHGTVQARSSLFALFSYSS